VIWKAAYEPLATGEVPLELEPIQLLDGSRFTFTLGVLIGGASPEAWPEMALWTKLLATSRQPFPWKAVLFGQTSATELSNLIADSQKGEWGIVAQPVPIELDRTSRCFGLIVQHERAMRGLIGPPTEDAWEAFEEEAIRRFSKDLAP
jgi:hypothetical protein